MSLSKKTVKGSMKLSRKKPIYIVEIIHDDFMKIARGDVLKLKWTDFKLELRRADNCYRVSHIAKRLN